MAARNLLDAIRVQQQPALFGDQTRSGTESGQAIGALVPPGMRLVYDLTELPGFDDYMASGGTEPGGWELERPGVWHHAASGHRFVEQPRPDQLAAARCTDCRQDRRERSA